VAAFLSPSFVVTRIFWPSLRSVSLHSLPSGPMHLKPAARVWECSFPSLSFILNELPSLAALTNVPVWVFFSTSSAATGTAMTRAIATARSINERTRYIVVPFPNVLRSTGAGAVPATVDRRTFGKGITMNRVRSLMLLAVAIALVLAVPVAAEEVEKNSHTGTFVSAASDGNSFVMKDKDGKEHTHTLAAGFKCIGPDGKECKLSEFKDGQKIRVTTKEGDKKTATKVEALK